jgi:hypothetical protein
MMLNTHTHIEPHRHCDFAPVYSVVEAGPHIYSFDNYNNAIAMYIARSDKGAYQDCNWCGVTLKKLLPGTDMKLVYERDGQTIVPAMPKSLYAEEIWDDLITLLEGIDDAGVNYHKDSMTKKYNVRCCPPKPKVTDEMKHDDPKLAAGLGGDSLDGLHNVYPKEIIPHNTGSNNGLGRIMRHMYAGRGIEEGTHDKYMICVTDCNIYHRINKVGCVVLRGVQVCGVVRPILKLIGGAHQKYLNMCMLDVLR